MSDKTLDLEAIEAREKAASEGPWEWNVNPTSRTVTLYSSRGSRAVIMDFLRWGMRSAQPGFVRGGIIEPVTTFLKIVAGRERHSSWYQTVDHPDADFIAHARADIPALIAEVRRLRNTVEALENSDAVAGIAEIRAGLSRHDPEIEEAVYSAALLCPFCGSDSIDPEYGGDGRAYVYCSSCGARGPTHDDYPSAVFEWNQRAAVLERPRPVETQVSVVRWVNEMFQDSGDLEYRVLMVTEEVVELGLACGISAGSILGCVNWALGKVTEVNSLDHAKEEIGDVLSTLYALATTIRCDAHAELDRKMAFNRTRPKSYYDAKTLAKRGALRQLAEEPKP